MTDSFTQATDFALAGATLLSRRPRPVAWIATLLLAVSTAPLAAQPRPAEVHARVGAAVFLESDPHVAAGVSYRQYLGTKGWALEPEYAFMTEGSHQDHMLILNVVKDFRPPSRTVVPYMVMGAGINFHRTSRWSGRGLGGLGWGVGFKRRIGQRVFIAPEVRIGVEPNLRFSIRFGFVPFG